MAEATIKLRQALTEKVPKGFENFFPKESGDKKDDGDGEKKNADKVRTVDTSQLLGGYYC